MSFKNLCDAEIGYLRKSIEGGRAVVVLGAGASATSANRVGAVPMGKKLAALLTERAGMPYDNESLSEVLTAVTPILGDAGCRAFYKERFLGVEPAEDLQELFAYTWKRLYTWNIDDSIDNLKSKKVQSHSIFNGIVDRVEEPIGPQQLQIIYLHGQITKPDKGLIMTETDYSQAIKNNRHFWYQEAARDYLEFCPIFIGSTLDEPILMAELERAKHADISSTGQAFLITPDDLSPIKLGSLKARGIVHIKATLADFVGWLRSMHPNGLDPKQVITVSNNYDEDALQYLKPADLEAAQALHPINPKNLALNLRDLPFQAKANMARRFLQGFPPTWIVAASDIPVELDALSGLKAAIIGALNRKSEIFVTLGQSGSGKSTATMMALLQITNANKDIALYDVAADTRSLKRALAVLGRVESRRAIVHVGELFLYGGSVREDLESLQGKDILIVGTARSSEWSEHLSRYIEDIAVTHEFQRFTPKDFDPLINRLVQYVPAPSFKRMSDSDRRKKFASSRSQLLIALQEATESSNFDDIISSEFTNLPDDDTKRLLVMVGIATIARVGVSTAMARQAFEKFAQTRSFGEAMSALTGIVADSGGGRLFARHELYVRHILEALTPPNEFLHASGSLLQTFSSYETPIIKYASRQDGILFKFLLNHDFIYERVKSFNDREMGALYYSSHEVDFQLDGQFWLQYGLFMGRIGHDDKAIELLTQSIRAYPDNLFAAHALADLQLKIVRNSDTFDERAKSFLDSAVTSLNMMDARHEIRTDHYPLVTLANGHIGCLLSHGMVEEASSLAPQYYDRLTQLEKTLPMPAVKDARQRQLLFATTKEWNLPLRGGTKSNRHKHRRSKSKRSRDWLTS